MIKPWIRGFIFNGIEILTPILLGICSFQKIFMTDIFQAKKS